jgi:hypothetical protein
MSDPRNDAEPSEARSAARAEQLEFRPRTGLSIFLIGICLVVSVLLFWVGGLLGHESVKDMDPLYALFFSVIPIKPFAWTGAAIWLGIGGIVARNLLSGRPSLVLSEHGIEHSGVVVPWTEVTGVRMLKDTHLAIDVVDPEALIMRRGWVRRLAARMNHRQSGTPIVLGANEAGGDAQVLLAALECRIGPRSE